jgi:tripartite-type tricarboxylate transporter receptor subunit TctC
MLNDTDVKERLNTLAFTPVGGTRKAFGDYIQSEIAKWGKAVKDSGARVD